MSIDAPQPALEPDPEIATQLILLAAAKHDVPALRSLLRTGSANVQDPETKFTPLHAAIAACDDSDKTANGYAETTNGVLSTDSEENDVVKTVRILLQNGAIWNDVDLNGETPGCVALRLGLKNVYEVMVDAGVRAEMLLSRLDEYELLNGAEGDDEGDDAVQDEDEGEDVPALVERLTKEEAVGSVDMNRDHINEQSEGLSRPPALVSSVPHEADLQNENYLQSTLRFQDGRILDKAGNGVMMAWETDIMKRTVELLCPESGKRVLNIGHGMGIIDDFFQKKSPNTHHIIEAHPGILARMKSDGWYDRPGVVVHEGRWQDVVPKIMEEGTLFDAIYFDTFAEDYKALRDFFSDCILGLLEDTGKWSFFNGLGADRQICYDVYTKVVEMDLFEAGFDTSWETLQIPEMSAEEWEGVKRRYWSLKAYKLPICTFFG